MHMEVYKRWKSRKVWRRSLREDHSHHHQQCMLLELIIISAQNLKKVTWFHRQEPYAVAKIDSCSERRTTDTDPVGGANPTWNAIFSFQVDGKLLERETALLTVEVYTRGFLWDNLVGTVRILLSDLVRKDKYFKGKCLTFMVMRPSGSRHGLLNIGVPPKSYSLLNSFKEGSVAAAMASQQELVADRNEFDQESVLLKHASSSSDGFENNHASDTESETESLVGMDSVLGTETEPVTETDTDSS